MGEAERTEREGITRAAMGLVAVSTVLQVAALVARSDAIAEGTTGRHVFSTVEMALVVGLLVVGVRILRWSRATGVPLVARTAQLCLASLVLCGLGDLVNRNYLEQHFQWDDVLRHSYLVTAIWCFFPGYALIVVANRIVTREAVGRGVVVASAVGAGLVGVGVYVGNHDPAMAPYPSTMILLYTVLLTVLAASTVWLVRAFGWTASRVVVAGCLLAVVADALIGNFWIASDHYPTVEHANWILYFASLAMIQRLPFLVADAATIR